MSFEIFRCSKDGINEGEIGFGFANVDIRFEAVLLSSRCVMRERR